MNEGGIEPPDNTGFRWSEEQKANHSSHNRLKEGLKIISGGTLDNTDGDPNKTSLKKRKSMKSEAHLSLANG